MTRVLNYSLVESTRLPETKKLLSVKTLASSSKAKMKLTMLGGLKSCFHLSLHTEIAQDLAGMDGGNVENISW